jgi:TatD DNase family protein
MSDMVLVDIGANLTHDSFDLDRSEVISRARQAGVAQMIVTGASVSGSEQALALANHHDGLFATAGIHPHHATESTGEALASIRTLLGQEGVRAVGETGLDFYRDFSPRDQQIASFERHLELAIDCRMPMFLHEREAYPRFAEIIRSHRDHLGDLVVHCFTGERDALHAYLDLDCHIGITGWICDERRGAHLLPLVPDIPYNRLMIETDAPYLLPRTIRPRPRTRRNEPHFLSEVARAIAAATGETAADVAERTTANARRFFRLGTP